MRSADRVQHGAKPARGSQLHWVDVVIWPRDLGGKSAPWLAPRRAVEVIARSVVLDQLSRFFFEGHLASSDSRALQFLDPRAGRWKDARLCPFFALKRVSRLSHCIRFESDRYQTNDSAKKNFAEEPFRIQSRH